MNASSEATEGKSGNDKAKGKPPAPRGWRKRKAMLISIAVFVAHLLGFISSVDALMSSRTSQGATAWIVSLNTFPWVSVPAYWVFGRTKFNGYVIARRELEAEHTDEVARIVEGVTPYIRRIDEAGSGAYVGEKLAKLPYLGGNEVDLLIDGDATFKSIIDGIGRAKEYILFQFYIVHDDALGRRVREALIRKAREGVTVRFLYDEIGSHKLPRAYLDGMREAGVRVHAFHTTKGKKNRFQINFRNHRKIVVIDGAEGWVGGHNVGDEYLGLNPEFGNWRDTHVRIAGPSVLQLQVSFAEDWHWATGESLEFAWTPTPSARGDATVLILPTGPADRIESASLMYQQAIHSARERIWIASPYFVPDAGVMSAMHLAAMRGVDIRVIIPDKPDSRLVYYSAFAFIGELLESGVRIFRYEDGFMHQKVFLVDDRLAGVGTANFDNRSFRLNFEVTALIAETKFIGAMEEMFEADFARSGEMTVGSVADLGSVDRFLSRASYLTSPIQ